MFLTNVSLMYAYAQKLNLLEGRFLIMFYMRGTFVATHQGRTMRYKKQSVQEIEADSF